MKNTSTYTDIVRISALQDNYIWLIVDRSQSQAICVDPGDAKVVLDYLDAHTITLQYILITHHHHDHVGGVQELCANYPQVTLIAPADERLNFVYQTAVDGDTHRLGNHLCHILHTPGHTMTHMVYHFSDLGAVFVGDTLFTCGCGRLFEGTAQQMWQSLNRIAALDDNTLIYCAHEYTQKNLSFALSVLPDDAALQQYQHTLTIPSVPTSLAHEKRCNLFLRAGSSLLKQRLHQLGYVVDHPVEVFTILRKWRDIA